MLHSALDVLWFYLPALVANLAVYLLYSLMGEGVPLDLHTQWRGQRLLGDGRTLLGTAGFMVFSLLVGILQDRVVESLYLGMGAQFGSVLNSFIKRRFGFVRSDRFFLLDPVDHVLGASLFYVSAYTLRMETFLWGVVICFSLHVTVNLFRKAWESLPRVQHNL